MATSSISLASDKEVQKAAIDFREKVEQEFSEQFGGKFTTVQCVYIVDMLQQGLQAFKTEMLNEVYT